VARTGSLLYRRIRIGKAKSIEALSVRLLSKNFILLRAKRGYIMCGYLNLNQAARFGDAAAKVSGVSTIEEALCSRIHSVTAEARKMGLFRGQTVRDALERIA